MEGRVPDASRQATAETEVVARRPRLGGHAGSMDVVEPTPTEAEETMSAPACGDEVVATAQVAAAA